MNNPRCIHASNLSDAWACAFIVAMEQSKADPLTDLTVSFDIYGEGDDLFTPEHNEVPDIRSAIDEELEKRSLSTTETVASTIFPRSLWDPRRDSEVLYERYHNIWHRVRRFAPNYNGTYFQRMVAYGWEEEADRVNAGLEGKKRKNQLQHVIDTYKQGNTRRSAFAVSIFNPHVDHTHERQRGFPCLQHVHFIPEDDGLIVTGVYATQLLLEKAYGNYLGLYRLGQFMAKEMGLTLVQVRCKSSRVKYANSSVKKKTLQDLLKNCNRLISGVTEEPNSVSAEIPKRERLI